MGTYLVHLMACNGYRCCRTTHTGGVCGRYRDGDWEEFSRRELSRVETGRSAQGGRRYSCQQRAKSGNSGPVKEGGAPGCPDALLAPTLTGVGMEGCYSNGALRKDGDICCTVFPECTLVTDVQMRRAGVSVAATGRRGRTENLLCRSRFGS